MDTEDFRLLGCLDGVFGLLFLASLLFGFALLFFFFSSLFLRFGGSLIEQLLAYSRVQIFEVVYDWLVLFRLLCFLLLPCFFLRPLPGVLLRDLLLQVLCNQRVNIALSFETCVTL